MSDARFDGKEYVAIGHITDANAYLRAARLIESADPDLPSSPIYFLLCHGMEIVLKAYILAAGGTEKELRPQNIRHHLDELRNRAFALGYSPSEKTNAVIDMLAPYHASHSFRYRDPGFKTYPTTDEVIQSLEAMLIHIEPVVRKCVLDRIGTPTTESPPAQAS
jgi:hypothetical protein